MSMYDRSKKLSSIATDCSTQVCGEATLSTCYRTHDESHINGINITKHILHGTKYVK